MPTAEMLLQSEFATLPDLIAAHACERGGKAALIDDGGSMDYAALDRAMDRFAAALQRDGVAQGAAVAIVGPTSIAYAIAYLGALRAGCVPTPLATSSTSEQIAAMIRDCGAPIMFDQDALGDLNAWLAPEHVQPRPVTIAPADPFNIIYSSGTTGVPKGIVQSHAMRWAHISRNAALGFGDAVTMISTPLYSNTTLVSFLPTLGWGGTCLLTARFDAARFLAAAARNRATHAMLVPVQYSRIMAMPDFDAHDLSSFRVKTCTSAPFPAALKADILARWPGLLIEYYGMTEGGGTCVLIANAHPDKLHTVGKPADGCDIRLIDDHGREVPAGEMGEVVGRSGAMMTGYHGRKDATSAAEWFDADGNRYIRHGDVGRFDADGFLTLLDRKKDVIISGGFNIYPSDIEGILNDHPCVADGTVVGVPSAAWGETPMGFYVPAPGADVEPETILAWVNTRVGRTQRLSGLQLVEELPRNAIGKVLKRDLRNRYLAALEVAE